MVVGYKGHMSHNVPPDKMDKHTWIPVLTKFENRTEIEEKERKKLIVYRVLQSILSVQSVPFKALSK